MAEVSGLLARGQAAQAEAALGRALQSASAKDRGWLLRERAGLRAAQGDLADALADALAAYSVSPGLQTGLTAAVALAAAGDAEDAQALVETLAAAERDGTGAQGEGFGACRVAGARVALLAGEPADALAWLSPGHGALAAEQEREAALLAAEAALLEGSGEALDEARARLLPGAEEGDPEQALALAQVERGRGAFEAARSWLSRAHAAARVPMLALQALQLSVALHAEAGELSAAEEAAREAAALLVERSAPSGEIAAALGLLGALEARSDGALARETLEEALRWAEEGPERLRAALAVQLAARLLAQGTESARAAAEERLLEALGLAPEPSGETVLLLAAARLSPAPAEAEALARGVWSSADGQPELARCAALLTAAAMAAQGRAAEAAELLGEAGLDEEAASLRAG